MKKTITLLLLIAVVIFPKIAMAQDGSIDPAFNPGGYGADGPIRAAFLQTDGKIIIAGDFYNYNEVSSRGIARLTTDGMLDASFVVGTGFNDLVKKAIPLPDGKILVAGTFSEYNGTPVNTLARLNPDGTLDTSFNPGAGFTVSYDIYTLAVQPDGKVLVGGWFNYYDNHHITFQNLLRINSDGSLDTTFVFQTGSNPVRKVIVQEGGKILYALEAHPTQPQATTVINRINFNGEPDLAFTGMSGSVIRQIHDMIVLSNGKIVASGFCDNEVIWAGRRIVMLHPNGIIDEGFDQGLGTGPEYYPATRLAEQQDGRIIISGRFSTYDGVGKKSVARIHTDGSLDTTFDAGSGVGDWDIDALVVQGNKLIIAGVFAYYNGIWQGRIARVMADETMGTNIPDAKSDELIAYRNGDVLDIASATEDITEIKVYGVDGKLIASQHGTSDSSVSIEGLSRNAIYIVKVRLSGNREVIKKIYY
jgi:uncharacterized delta-60 repeat protein